LFVKTPQITKIGACAQARSGYHKAFCGIYLFKTGGTKELHKLRQMKGKRFYFGKLKTSGRLYFGTKAPNTEKSEGTAALAVCRSE